MSYSKRLFYLVLLAVLWTAACSPGTSNNPNQPQATIPPTPFVIQADKLPKDDSGIPLVARVNSPPS